MTLFIDSLASISASYEVLFCDVWGVLHDGQRSFSGACRALIEWRAHRGPVILVSNSPRPAPDVRRQLIELGVPENAWSELVTSGDATRQLIADRGPGTVYTIGPDRDGALYDGFDLRFTKLDLARFIVCTGPREDEFETPEDYRELLLEGVQRGLDMICANPDRVVQRGSRLVYCGGALADLYAQLGGQVLMAGKPHDPIYDLSMLKAGKLLAKDVQAHEILAIGDGLATDIAGANKRGVDALFIASGINGSSIAGIDGRLDVQAVDGLLDRAGVSAKFTMAELAW